MKKIYLDFAATTPVDPKVLQAMKPYFAQKFGNASEQHSLGQEAREAIETSRNKIANFLGASNNEIIFTGSATESINLSHKGLLEALASSGMKKFHIITSQVEHKAMLETCKHLEKLGWANVTYLPVDKFGMVSVTDIENATTEHTVLVSIMYVNNEVGTIQPIKEIGNLLIKLNKRRTVNHEPRILFHTDATQAIQYLDCNVDRLGIDFLSLTGHKIYAPKGVGALFVRSGTPLIRQMDGGGQELKLRSGTENVPYIVGLGKAVEVSAKCKVQRVKSIRSLQKLLISRILQFPGVKLTGHPIKRAPHIVSFVVNNVEGEALVLMLSAAGIMVSTGSACTSNSLEPSHVLTAMGVSAELSHGSVRFSLGKHTTEKEINDAVRIFEEIVQKLRLMAPQI